jgi:hypothetical protein
MNVLSIIATLATVYALASSGPKPGQIQATQNAPVAVLELFTSEGCSSCPPADKLLTETIEKADAKGQAVYALSFHVDYWNRLGWKDPFSEAQFSTRQRDYARQFNTASVYTPQVVLNGQYEFVGSNKARLSTLLAQALNQSSSVGVALSTTGRGDELTVNYALTGGLAGNVVNIAVVSQHESRDVNRGENSGRKLVHNNVVRVFETRPATAKGSLKLNLPDKFDRANGAVIAYVQNARSLMVLGAGRTVIP